MNRDWLPIKIEPRTEWPWLPIYGVSGDIGEEHQFLPGRALCRYRGSGKLGELVSRGKYKDERFSDRLVEFCVSLIEEWRPKPEPSWVTCVPSRSRPNLVPNFAKRLADDMRITFYEALEVTARIPAPVPQKEKGQAHNLDGAFRVKGYLKGRGPVLLVDDMVNSRWTMTVCTWLLRKHGSGEVWPLALAMV